MLAIRLNVAVGLYQKALSENATDPVQATADLQNASNIAGSVLASAKSAQKTGVSARQTQDLESIGASIGIVAAASLVYIYGARIYHEIWFYLYRNYRVRASGG